MGKFTSHCLLRSRDRNMINFTQKVRTPAGSSPDPRLFLQSSPPAPSAASSRSCGWNLKPDRRIWAEGVDHKAEAGVVAAAAAPG